MESSRRRPRSLSIATALSILGLSFGALLTSTPHAAAVTYVGGTISTDTIWGDTDNEYILIDHVTVASGFSLTIRPGTIVRFEPMLALFVEGTLWADGLPGNEIQFLENATISVFPPMGIQFNATGSGSVSYGYFQRMERPVTAIDSAPSMTNNFVAWSVFGFALVRSAAVCTDNAVMRAQVGVYLAGSDATVERNYLNGTNTGIEASFGGMPYIAQNVIANTSGNPAIGIHVTVGTIAELWSNLVVGVSGSRGLNGAAAGDPGEPGGSAIGILVDTAPSVTINGNAVSLIEGGQGGNGIGNPGGTGGEGGAGGSAAGVAVGATGSVIVNWNSVSEVTGGRGGLGGGSPVTNLGGRGGDGGEAAGLQFIGTYTNTSVYNNWIDRMTGGFGGHGGDATFDGDGGHGGEIFGIVGIGAANADASADFVYTLRGGNGGNSTALGGGSGFGGDGGSATGIAWVGDPGTLTIHTNTIFDLVAGNGGWGANGGHGGNTAAASALGDADNQRNAANITSNSIQDLAAGKGGVGGRTGGAGGGAAGITVALVSPLLSSNTIWNVLGGSGGTALDGSDGGRGGDAGGVSAFLLTDGWSSGDSISAIAEGTPGSGPPIQASYGVGFAFEGNLTLKTTFTVENGTIANVGTYDLWVRAMAGGTTINTPFDPAKVAVAPTSSLTVKNFLSTSVFWTDGFTSVPGASILVTEDGTTVWSFVSATGMDQWLLTTDRVYMNSSIPTDVQNDVSVSYLSYTFASNPRTVDMASSTWETFVMNDGDPPVSTTGALPSYTTTTTFTVSYTASDGTGAGLSNITLWFQKDGGGWTSFATQPAGNFGSFSFTASGDGTYEFETTAEDLAGNVEPGPGTNESWTIVDTTKPASSVATLPTWQSSLSFLVAWGPDPGTTDIVRYRIEYNRGFGWVPWLPDTTQTSGTFVATSQGVYQFRSIARDAAGNVESVTGNDTWTIVDTVDPVAFVLALAPWQTALAFTVAWQDESDDIASYRIQVRDDGGVWADWIPFTTATSALYTGVDGHTYEYRAIATDYAGNIQTPNPGNDTWTRVDVSPPDSSMAVLPSWESVLTFAIAWGPAGGTADIATYTVQVSEEGGPWTSVSGYINTTATSGSYTGADGLRYAFQSLATDYAGNTEPASPSNDTWTTVDVTPPSTNNTPSGTQGSGGWWTSAVTVTLAASDATSGVSGTDYRIDGGPWLIYSAPFAVSGDGMHLITYRSRDVAGLQEGDQTAPFNLDGTPPTTSPSFLGTLGENGWYRGPVTVTLSVTDPTSGPASTAYRMDGGAWVTYTGPIGVAADDQYTVEYYSTDDAGLVEATRASTFKIDSEEPFVMSWEPTVSGTNTTPAVVLTFSEGMNRGSVEGAFTISPFVSGVFSWSADNRTMTFVSGQPLERGRTYFVAIGTNSKDPAGNGLQQTLAFSFSVAALPPTTSTGGLGDYLWIIAMIAVGLGATLFVVLRRMGARSAPAPVPATPAKKESQATIDDVFLLYRDGILIKHETRRLKPDIDTDILSGMLTAVQAFVKDSFRSEEGELDELRFGEMHILIGRGKWIVLAAMIQGGDGAASMRGQIEKCIADMESEHASVIEKWDGNMTIAKTLSPFIKKLIRGDYTDPGPPPNV